LLPSFEKNKARCKRFNIELLAILLTSSVWEEESQATTDTGDGATEVAPSEDGSEGGQIILDPSSKDGRTLQASPAFRTLGITDPNEDPFLNLQQNGQRSGGQQRREKEKRGQPRNDENKHPNIRQTQPNPQPRTTERRESSRDSLGAARSARFPAPRASTRPKIWAEPEGLVTTRQSIQRAICTKIEANKEKFIKGHDEDVDIIIYVSNWTTMSH
jgi:hypothetical protein